MILLIGAIYLLLMINNLDGDENPGTCLLLMIASVFLAIIGFAGA